LPAQYPDAIEEVAIEFGAQGRGVDACGEYVQIRVIHTLQAINQWATCQCDLAGVSLYSRMGAP
jgi:hypothetical protein